MENVKKVMVSMSEKTLNDIDIISDNIKDNNRSSIVSKAVNTLKFISEIYENEGELLILDKDGKMNKVKIIGL